MNAVDRQLFRASTVVTLGNGEKASFWQSTWLHGQALMDRFPDLFKWAWRKNKTVKEELHSHNWTRGLWRMQTVEEMASFVQLWDLVQSVQLSDQQDQITWRWTPDGTYTSKSAYNAQFLGSFSNFRGENVWRADAEGKHKFFAWLLIQSKILTADKLLARQWPCNPLCPLCNLVPETASHLILHCQFAQQVWALLETWTLSIIGKPVQGLDVMTWWEKELAHLPKKDRRLKAAVMIYGAWNIWKARNKKVFEQKNMNPGEVLQEIKFEMQCRSSACGRPELSSFNV